MSVTTVSHRTKIYESGHEHGSHIDNRKEEDRDRGPDSPWLGERRSDLTGGTSFCFSALSRSLARRRRNHAEESGEAVIYEGGDRVQRAGRRPVHSCSWGAARDTYIPDRGEI
jgi:hypothetical protein